MVRGIEGNEMSTPKAGLKKSNSASTKTTQSSMKQQGIAGFFKPKAAPASSPATAASSPPVSSVVQNKENEAPAPASSSPIRRSRNDVSYVESDEDDEGPFKPVSGNGRASKRRRINPMADSDDEYAAEPLLPEDDHSAPSSPVRKQPPLLKQESSEEIPTVQTTEQWRFDPEAPNVDQPPREPTVKAASTAKQKAHMTEPTDRHTWLAHILDADKNPPDHPDYDPRTLFIPPMAMQKLSAFEQQYWAIKKNFYDTIVFFKKGKFYELYENDATIGHQLFDLKLTDRVNMRMVGVPEASLEHWANQFIAKGFKIARVDQLETALGKDMRERDTGGKKEEKIIRRELAAVLTRGTLVEGSMLQDEMATYCAAIKESEVDGHPHFGIAFVDTATAQFHFADFEDDVDMTRFETFVAQVRPDELLIEKGNLSPQALRILKNNTPPTTIWNTLKPEKEFLTAERTRMKIDGEGYYENDAHDGNWPEVMEEAMKTKPLVFSAFGALLWYLHTLKIDQQLVTLRNFAWYDPIRKASSLVLDGQSLINLEIFANTYDGTAQGTLFAMLNRCVTPFGKRMLRQWICHPLADTRRINQRFDAVDSLIANQEVMDRFTASLSKLPDLERLISRVHAGKCKPQDFVKVVEGFEQIDYTMTLLGSSGKGSGILGQLLSSMPDLEAILKPWQNAFDRAKARESGLLIPEPGFDESFDQSQEVIDSILASLDKLLNKTRKDFGSSIIKFTDNGKEIYQLEIPVKVKAAIPKNWRQMSATKQCKRWYSPELEELVQQLKEAQESHAQVVTQLNWRFCDKFDIDYVRWLEAIKVISHLDCLISLAKASTALGSPSCRPQFVDDVAAKSVLHFKNLRHPCIETTTSFIPNDIDLGGESASVSLLTGANAAGKSTILRMTCVAVILAQVGCYVPCEEAIMTPVDRIMSRLGAQDNIFAGQSTFMVELAETKKILSEATPRSLVILDELGRGTSSYDGVAVAQAVLHHVATHVGALGYFATHYHSLATEFQHHPEIRAKRMAVRVEHDIRDVTFLYKLEDGVAEGSYGMHCAAMCGIPDRVIDSAERAAQSWEHTERIKESLEKSKLAAWLPLGVLSDVSWLLQERKSAEKCVSAHSLDVLRRAIAEL